MEREGDSDKVRERREREGDMLMVGNRDQVKEQRNQRQTEKDEEGEERETPKERYR